MSSSSHRYAAGLWEVQPQLHLGFAAAAWLLPCLLAIRHLGNDLAGPDGAGLALAARQLGLLAPPGYPVYLTAAHLWLRWLPFGGELWKLCLFSAVCLGFIAFCLYLCARRLAFAPSVAFSASLLFTFTTGAWRELLAPSPVLFAFCGIALVLYLAVHWLGPNASHAPHPVVAALLLGLLVGAFGGDQPVTWSWLAPLLLLGVFWVWRHRLHPGRILGAAGVGLVLGWSFSVLYLLSRAFSAHAFVDTQFVPQLAELRRTLSWGLRLAWLRWYFFLGPQFAPASGAAPGATLLASLRALPFLGLIIVVIGAGRNLWDLFLTPPKILTQDRDRASRLAVGSLPFLALLAGAVFWPRADRALTLTLAVAGFFWSLPALEYVYEQLGNPEVAGGKPKTPRPTWVGYAALACIPLLYYLHSVPDLRAQVRRAADPGSTLNAAAIFLHALPAGALVVFPDSREAFPLLWVQRSARLRPDVTLVNFSDPWPQRSFGGRASLEVLAGSAREGWERRLNFATYWRSGLAAEVAAGRAVFVLLRPEREDPLLQRFLTAFTLDTSPGSLTLGPATDPRAHLWGFRVLGPLTPSEPPLGRSSEAPGNFLPELRCLSGRAQTPQLPWPPGPVVAVSLGWEAIRTVVPTQEWVVFRVAPRTELPDPARGEAPAWETLRPLGPGAPDLWRSGRRVGLMYQLLTPYPLPAGPYRVWVGLQERDRQRLRAAVTGDGRSVYWLRACDFSVAAGGGAVNPGRSYPASVSNPVPGK